MRLHGADGECASGELQCACCLVRHLGVHGRHHVVLHGREWRRGLGGRVVHGERHERRAGRRRRVVELRVQLRHLVLLRLQLLQLLLLVLQMLLLLLLLLQVGHLEGGGQERGADAGGRVAEAHTAAVHRRSAPLRLRLMLWLLLLLRVQRWLCVWRREGRMLLLVRLRVRVGRRVKRCLKGAA